MEKRETKIFIEMGILLGVIAKVSIDLDGVPEFPADWELVGDLELEGEFDNDPIPVTALFKQALWDEYNGIPDFSFIEEYSIEFDKRDKFTWDAVDGTVLANASAMKKILKTDRVIAGVQLMLHDMAYYIIRDNSGSFAKVKTPSDSDNIVGFGFEPEPIRHALRNGVACPYKKLIIEALPEIVHKYQSPIR